MIKIEIGENYSMKELYDAQRALSRCATLHFEKHYKKRFAKCKDLSEFTALVKEYRSENGGNLHIRVGGIIQSEKMKFLARFKTGKFSKKARRESINNKG